MAIQDTTAALSMDPDNLKALLRRALAYAALDEPGKAEPDLRAVLDTDLDVVRTSFYSQYPRILSGMHVC